MRRALAWWLMAGLGIFPSLAQDASKAPKSEVVGVKHLLVFGDTSTNNPPAQQALMEKSIHEVADTFKALDYKVDLIPTTELSTKVVKEKLANYARTLGTNDTFVLYSHSHGGPRGTFFANWQELTDGILKLPARRVVILVMSCHSGNLTDMLQRRKAEWAGRSQSGRSLVVLTPVSADQLCGPSPERGVGNPFTYAVTTAMHGAADVSKDGRVGMQELVEYVLKTTHEKSRDQSHTPQFAGEFPTNAVFEAVLPK